MANEVVRLPDTPGVANLVASPAAPEVVSITVPVQVVGGSDGPLTLKQKIQAAYKTVVALVGTITTSLVAVLGVPGLPEQYKGPIAGAALGCTVLGVFLVSNKEFVEKL